MFAARRGAWRGWALLSKANERTWASNDGYPDVLGSHYVYDSAVGNHLRVAVGDVVVLRDSQVVHGISRIDLIDTEPAMKTRYVCPNCGRTGIDTRASLQPAFRCVSCRHEFDTPDKKEVPVTRYSARYAQQWQPLSGLQTSDIEPALDRARQRAIRRCDLDKLSEILERFGVLIPELGESIPTRWDMDPHLLPMIADETLNGPDLLGIDPDARALGALMAAKHPEPPLAIAVYGEWGRGKSFFMRRVEKAVAEFAGSDREGLVFEPALRQITFGAWHYSRGNLWASMLEHIFSSLSPQADAPDQLYAAATASIAAIQQQVDQAENDVRKKELEAKKAGKKVKEASAQQNSELKKLQDVRGRDLLRYIQLDQDLRDQTAEAAQQLNLSAATDSAEDVLAVTRQIIDLGSRAVVLATAGKRWYLSPLACGTFAATFCLALTSILALAVPGIFGAVGSVVSILATTVASGASWVGRQSVLARKLLGPAERVQQEIERRVEEQKREQAAKLTKLEEATRVARDNAQAAVRKQNAATKDLEAAKRARDELTPGKLLQRYIADRATSGDYDEHLGVVGAVHRDLSRLSDYLKGAASDPENGTKRIILYIDDLDRCAPTVVAEVLETVHLLLALPLFVVMVGIDRNIADRALRAFHPELIGCDEDAPTPGDYLEKIFQLKYALPPMTPDGCHAVLDAMASRPQPWPRPEVDQQSSPTAASADGSVPLETDELDGTVSDVSSANHPGVDEQLVEALTFTDEDRDVLRQVAPLVVVSPRRVKRFYNALVVLRARVAAEPHDSAALAVICAIFIGAPLLGSALRQLVCEAAPSISFGEWAANWNSADPKEDARLVEFLQNAGSLADVPMAALLQNVPMVSRYT
ncbi:P-loop NTPase fold protein [Nocardia tengchongensis]|uniref:P-loop NTPase fold protein n=1 Tax=Nocardia tengchongensis TaxID=2055889 RepID=UPI0036CA75C2